MENTQSPQQDTTPTETDLKWEMNYLEAAIFLQEGENNDKFNSHPKTREALPAYILTHNHWFYTLDLWASLLLLALATAERPSIGIFKEVSTGVHSSLELFALAILGISIILQLRWVGWKNFLSHKRSAIKSSIWVVMVCEAFVVLVRRTSHFRITRCLRPIFLVDNRYFGGVRRFLRQILQSILPILEVLFLLLLTLVTFTILGFWLFSSNPKDPYFTTFGQGFVSLYVLLTTANYPDLMMPSYAASRWSAAFFIAYIAITVYFLMNLMLAIVFTIFSNIEKDKFRKLLLHKREACRRAFKLLVTHNQPNRVSFRHFEGVLKKFNTRIKRKVIYLTFRQLNKSQSGYLCLKEFCNLFEALEYDWKLQKIQQPYFHDIMPPLRSICRAIRSLVKSSWFHGVVYFVIFCSGVLLILEAIYVTASGDQADIYAEASWYQVLCVMFFVVEIGLKLIGYGGKDFFKCNWNRFDFCIVLFSVIGTMLQHYHKALYLFALLNPLRILRFMQLRKRYKEIFEIFAMLVPTILSAVIVIMIVYYFFSIIGMELFSAYDMKNCCVNTTVEQFYKDDNTTVFVNYYYLNTFDNIFIAGVTLFELTVVNNWFIIMEGYASVSGNGSRVYFMVFYLVMMVIMSLVMAFILEAFTFRMEYNETFKNAHTDDKVSIMLQKEELEFIYANNNCQSALQEFTELKNQQGIIQYEGSKVISKAVLQRRMFQNIIPEWIRQHDSGPHSTNVEVDPGGSTTFSSVLHCDNSLQQNCLEMLPDEPIFPSGILPAHLPTTRDV